MYTSNIVHNYPRDTPSRGMTRQTIIITATCSSAGAVILVLLLLRLIRNCCRGSSHSAPLPPVQPLAHHREHQIAKIESSLPRPQTWYGPNLLPAPHSFGSLRGSKSSLLGHDSLPSLPSNEPPQTINFRTHSSDQMLTLPSPSFHPGSSSSLGSSDASCGSRPSEPFPLLSSSTVPLVPRSLGELRPDSAASVPTRRPRPLSMSSTYSYSTLVSRTSRHAVRGLPHDPRSQIQIILPAPLARGITSYNDRQSIAQPSSRLEGDGFDRRSTADQWLVVETNGASEKQGSFPSLNSSVSPLPARSGPRVRPVSMVASLSPMHSMVSEPSFRTHPNYLAVPPQRVPSHGDSTSLRSVRTDRWSPSSSNLVEEEEAEKGRTDSRQRRHSQSPT